MQITDGSDTRSPSSYSFTWFDRFCLWYPPAWLIVLNRHWQHYKPDPTGWRWSEYPLFLVPGGFYVAVLVRALRLALRSLFIRWHRRPPCEPQPAIADPVYQRAFRHEILAPIAQRYFRAKLTGSEELPRSGPLILILNHAGMCFPWDFLCLGWVLGEQRDWFVQPLAHPLFFDHLWLRWWLPPGWAVALGGVRAEKPSFEAAVAQKTIMLCAPEGWRGIAKGWPQRHQLAPFDPSFLRFSLRYHVPVLPMLCTGSETLHPYAVNLGWMARLARMPMFPLSPLIPIFALFPSMGVWAMPSQLTYHLQPLWQPWPTTATTPDPLPRQTVVHRMTQALRSRLQHTLDHLTHP